MIKASNVVHERKKTICSLCLYEIILASFISLLGAKYTEMSQIERKIILLPIGEIRGWVLDDLEKDLAVKFDIKVERREQIQVPEDAFDPLRKQYISSSILKKLHALSEAEKNEIVLAIVNIDLYAAGLNFVFGEAEFGGQYAIISLARLHQSFYSLPENKDVFIKRAKKESVHELGHVFRLEHCPSAECVMHFSNSLLDTDRKSASFCSRCQAHLERLIK